MISDFLIWLQTIEQIDNYHYDEITCTCLIINLFEIIKMISKIKYKLTLKSDTETGLNCRSNQWLLNFIYRQFKMLCIGTNSLMKQ